MESISYFIHGLPASKGSLTRMPNGAMLPAGTKASRERFTNWREAVRHASIDSMHDHPPYEGPIRMLAEFRMPHPHLPKYKMGWWPHVKQPDVDKLMRGLLDPLKGIVWRDDSQVCFATVNKTYAWDGRTGAYLIVDFLADDFMQEHSEHVRAVTDVIESL